MAFKNIKQAADNLTDPSKADQGPQRGNPNRNDLSSSTLNVTVDEQFYTVNQENWLKALPYGFRFRDRDGNENVMFLPISPQNITITTHYATNVMTTLYATVEEHSEQRYFDIMIEGTTGIMPRYTQIIKQGQLTDVASAASAGRSSYDDAPANRLTINSNIAGGFFSQAIGAANQALDRSQDLIEGKESLNISGINSNENTGYFAFHRLYKFLLKYKADAAGVDNKGNISDDRRDRTRRGNSSHPLSFLNYKDGNMYDVAVQKFSLKRSANNPMLYNYSIALRAYNIRDIGELLKEGEDASFADDRLAELGLNGVQSNTLLSEVSEASQNAKQTAAAAKGGFDAVAGG